MYIYILYVQMQIHCVLPWNYLIPGEKENHRLKSAFKRGYVSFLESSYTNWEGLVVKEIHRHQIEHQMIHAFHQILNKHNPGRTKTI